jgi:hypothetical protein
METPLFPGTQSNKKQSNYCTGESSPKAKRAVKEFNRSKKKVQKLKFPLFSGGRKLYITKPSTITSIGSEVSRKKQGVNHVASRASSHT